MFFVGADDSVGPQKKQPKRENLRRIRWFPREDRGVRIFGSVYQIGMPPVAPHLQPRRRVQSKALCAADGTKSLPLGSRIVEWLSTQ